MEVPTQNLTPSSSSPFKKHSMIDNKMVLDHEKEDIGHSEKLISMTTDMMKSMVIKNGVKDEECQTAALKMQKAYRGYRTRRQLADSAVLAEEYWWQAIDHARLHRSTTTFYNVPETPISRWNRIEFNASKIGKGFALHEKAKTLAFQHWIEAIDPRHRYGHNLVFYYEEWGKGDAGQPFFYWLDIGNGKDSDLEKCPRAKLLEQIIKYLGPQEREHYEYIIHKGIIHHKLSGEPMDTTMGSQEAKWIFVMSTSKKLYAGEKKKGRFHHSSFLAGGTTLAAGRLVTQNGEIKSISAYSGHYRPTDENLGIFKDFLSENGVNLSKVEIRSSTDDFVSHGDSKSGHGIALEAFSNIIEASTSLQLGVPDDEDSIPLESIQVPSEIQRKISYKRTLSGGLQSPRADVSEKEILQRINSKKATRSYQLGHQLSLKWSTGAGPRIGCVADYPEEIRQQALKFVKLS